MNHTVTEWREMILAGWEKWGTGKPLDTKTVEHLAAEFAKPLMIEIKPYDFDLEYPWRGHGAIFHSPLMFTHRSIFIPPTGWAWDQTCAVTALVKEGPKSIVLVKP